MKEFLQNILIYVIIIAVLRGLVTEKKYRQYFQFFSGVILIFIFLMPAMSFFHSDRDWYYILEEKLLQMDMADIKGEMKVAEEGFEQVLRSRYEEVVGEQVKILAAEKDITLKDMEVVLTEKDGTWEVAEVSGEIAGDAGQEVNEKIAVETVTIGNQSVKEREEDTSKRGKALRKQICDSFTLGKEQVHLWKERK